MRDILSASVVMSGWAMLVVWVTSLMIVALFLFVPGIMLSNMHRTRKLGGKVRGLTRWRSRNV